MSSRNLLLTFAGPPDGSTVDTLPATFHCLIMENFEPVTIEWLIFGLPLNHSFVTGSLQADYVISGDSQENITFNGFADFPTLIPPLPISCRQLDPPRVSYANFTLRGTVQSATILLKPI